MSYTVTMLCWAYIINDELYESMGLEEKIRQEIRWASEYFIKCHQEKGVYYFQAMDGGLRYSYKEAAELTNIINYSLKLDEKNPCSIIAAEPAAALAAISRAFLEVDHNFSKLCLNHAKDLMELAESSVHNNKRMSIGEIKGYEDKFLWACLWIFIASGEQQYFKKALKYSNKDEIEQKEDAIKEWGTNCNNYEKELNELLGRFADGGVFEKMFHEWKIRHKRSNKNNSLDANGASEVADKTGIIRMVKPRDNVEYLVGKQSIDVAAELMNHEEVVKTVEFYANGEKFGETKKSHQNVYQSSYAIPASKDQSELEVKLRVKAMLDNGDVVKSDTITVYVNVSDTTRDERIKRKKAEEERKLMEDAKKDGNRAPFPFNHVVLPESIKESEEELVENKTNELEQNEPESAVKDEEKMKEDTNSNVEAKKTMEQGTKKESVSVEEKIQISNNHERNQNFWEPVVGQPIHTTTQSNQVLHNSIQSEYAATTSYPSEILVSKAPEKLYKEKLKVELICEESKNHDILCAMVKLKNVSMQNYDLSKLKVRYYFSKSRNNPTCKIDQAGLRTSKAPFYADMLYAMECQSHKSGSFIAGADYYVEAGFKSNQLFSQDHMLNIQFRLQSTEVNDYFFINDYSFNKANKVVVFYNGDVLEGMMP